MVVNLKFVALVVAVVFFAVAAIQAGGKNFIANGLTALALAFLV